MAGNTRGKLKEELEGVHRNLDWAEHHISKALILIADHKPELSEGLRALYDSINTLDGLTQELYSKI